MAVGGKNLHTQRRLLDKILQTLAPPAEGPVGGINPTKVIQETLLQLNEEPWNGPLKKAHPQLQSFGMLRSSFEALFCRILTTPLPISPIHASGFGPPQLLNEDRILVFLVSSEIPLFVTHLLYCLDTN